jgi:hypothetical protein
MKSFEERFYRENPGLFRRFTRNALLLLWLARGLFEWVWTGRALRKAYKRAREDNDAVVLEDYIDADVE